MILAPTNIPAEALVWLFGDISEKDFTISVLFSENHA